MTRNECRRCAQQQPAAAQPADHQTGIRETTNPDGHVDLLGDQIHISVVQGKIHMNGRVVRRIPREHAAQSGHRKLGGDGHSQGPAHLLLIIPGLALSVVKFRKDASASDEKRLPGFGERQFACRSVQQSCAKLAFEGADVFTGHCRCQTESSSRSGETALIHRGHKKGHAEKSVHGFDLNGSECRLGTEDYQHQSCE
jgi:hypothetical protein